MTKYAALDQTTLLELWKIACDTEIAANGKRPPYKNLYIYTESIKGQKNLRVQNEGGTILTRFMRSMGRFLNKRAYMLTPGSPTAELLKQLHDKTCDLDESTCLKAINSSNLSKNGLSANDILNKIKFSCRCVNHILQHVMERKLENSLESRQESIKIFMTSLLMPTWGLGDIRKAETQHAHEELRRAQEAAASKVVSIIEKIQFYLDAATAQLNVAMTGKEEAEDLLQRARIARSQDNLNINAAKAQECASAADEASNQVTSIAMQADQLVRAKTQEEKQPILNFSEVEELKKIREILNVVGQVAEYAQAARNAASEINKLAAGQR